MKFELVATEIFIEQIKNLDKKSKDRIKKEDRSDFIKSF